ncbi:hypothetical protein B0H15DRAFT_954548 [Mycena belliarum]|uniref:Uncharacterized protein n=1 Tax=Mycena belliarum TaxID=1033014 RepID=A0AAD6XKY5_9AGAR|nr:hypothetical protein B0H15DRAFT_954548 [Mycena belliae]
MWTSIRTPSLVPRSSFWNVDPTYDDAPPTYIVFEADDALVGTGAGASADDCSNVNDYASSRCDTPRASYAASEPNNSESTSVSDTNVHTSGDDYRSVNAARYAFGIRGGNRVYAAADDFGTRGLYAAADAFDIRSGDCLHAFAGAFAVTTSESRPAPARKFARVNGAYSAASAAACVTSSPSKHGALNLEILAISSSAVEYPIYQLR